MKRLAMFAALVMGLSAEPASAAFLVSGSFDGPDTGFQINMHITNAPGSTEDIVSIVLNGGTGYAFPVLWDSAGAVTDPPGAMSFISGQGTQVLSISFANLPDGFNPGETFSLTGMDPDGNPGPVGVTVGELAGIQVTITGRDSSVFQGVFVANPTPGAGLTLVSASAAVPEPASIASAAMAVAGVAGVVARRRLRAKV